MSILLEIDLITDIQKVSYFILGYGKEVDAAFDLLSILELTGFVELFDQIMNLNHSRIEHSISFSLGTLN